ncbi:MAG: hypothetical protein PHQ43_13735 [Dehalococcoidales bacterium]|nr:hypothetical protein [Dehalococcoidales bacterium]
MDNVTEFFSWRKSEELRAFIDQQAARHCGKDPETYADMIQEAWLYITLLPPDSNMRALKATAYNAIQAYYRYTKKHRHIAFETFFNAVNHRIY